MEKKIKFLIVLLIIFLPAALLAQLSTYKIKGKIGNSASQIAYLRYTNAEGVHLDSTKIKNGAFIFAGSLDQPRPALLITTRKDPKTNIKHAGFIEFYLESGNISVFSPDSIENAQITGSLINNDNAKLKILLASVNAKIQLLNKKIRAASPEQRKSEEFNDEINEMSHALSQEKKNVYLTFIKENPNSEMSIFALKNYAGPIPNVTEVDAIFNSLSANVRSGKMGLDYAAAINKLKTTAIGAVAPDFTQNDTLGKPVSLRDFKGKFVLLDFWASWCGPCRAENPNVVKNFNKYKDKGFTIIGISLDQPGQREAWLKAINKDGLNWTQLSDLNSYDNAVAKKYNVDAIPQNFLIDPNGKIIAKNVKGELLEKTLEDLIK
ncbi:MAG: AhpC/TSA family protein [Bacteroidota bacterium]|nr:AhpC/TSA family protein [Bacteroidota bacterium]